jgi:hypothetical protein
MMENTVIAGMVPYYILLLHHHNRLPPSSFVMMMTIIMVVHYSYVLVPAGSTGTGSKYQARYQWYPPGGIMVLWYLLVVPAAAVLHTVY